LEKERLSEKTCGGGITLGESKGGGMSYRDSLTSFHAPVFVVAMSTVALSARCHVDYLMLKVETAMDDGGGVEQLKREHGDEMVQ
jgi:hypothetical protein